jgi:LysR family transcriptional regulator, benzoate and cis,cis-muconate-responsive activator of ben and cat genes
MELRHLRYFVAAAEAENVSRAALKLHVSQPALSRQIRDLEEELGFPLFERGAKSVRLTDAGKSFLAEARAVLGRAEEAIQRARMVANGGGELAIGYAPSLVVRFLSPALRIFQTDTPPVRVKLHDLSTEEMLAGLRAGELALAFMARPGKSALRGLHFERLLRDSLCLALPHQHRFARRRSVQLLQAAQEPLVVFTRKDYPEYHEYLESVFAPTNTRLRIAEEHDSVASLMAAVEAGCGVAVVPQSLSCSAGPRLKLVRLMPAPEPLEIGAVWVEGALRPGAERLLKAAQKAIASVP